MEKAIEFLRKQLNELKAQRFTSVHDHKISGIEIAMEMLENEQQKKQ